MRASNSLFSITALIASLLSSMPSANADLVVSKDLGVLKVGSSTPFSGNTAIGENNADTYLKTGTIVSYGNEIVFQFTIEETMRVDVTSVTLTGDPDVFILSGLETEVTEPGLLDATGAILAAYLDGTPPENAVMGLLKPGTYYISVDSFGGVDATFSYNLIATAGSFPAAVTELGAIAEENAPFTLDTIGNTIDTELGLWNEFGSFLTSNDDAPLDFDGDGFSDIFQSQINMLGLASGTYYVAVGSWDTLWTGPFTFVGGDEGGTLTLNYGPTPVDVIEPTPAENSVTGELAVGGVLWYSFEIGTITPPAPAAPLRITNVTRNTDGQMDITFNSVGGNEYAVDISTDMSEWQELTDGLVGEAKTTTYTHASPDRAARTLFYRIRDLEAGGEEGPSLNDGLVAYYPFNGSFDDISGNGYHLIEENPGNTQFNEENTTASFDSSQYGLHYQTTAEVIPDGAQTMSCSFKFSGEQNQWDGPQMIMAIGQHGATWFQAHLQPTVDGWLFKSFVNVPIIPGVWYHMACVRDQQLGLDLTYLNGEKVGEKPIDNNNVTSPLISIGVLKGATLDDWTRQPFIGSIDNARIYNRALSAGEVSELYDLEKPEEIALSEGLVAHYPFNGNANDASGNNRHLSTQGQPTFEEGTNGLLSAQFDDNADGFEILGQDTPENIGAASVSVWFEQDDPSGSQVVVGLTRPSTSRFIIYLEDGAIRYQHGMERGGRLEGGVFENQPTLPNGWNNFVLITSGNGQKVSGYLNGQFLGDVSAGINLTGPTNYMVGAYTEIAPADQYRQAFRGRIQNLRIYNRTLSAGEVSELYDLEKPSLE